MILNSFIKDINFVEEVNIFNTINFREKVNIDVNETGKRLILEEWSKIDQELREQNCNDQNGYIMWGKRSFT